LLKNNWAPPATGCAHASGAVAEGVMAVQSRFPLHFPFPQPILQLYIPIVNHNHIGLSNNSD